jgi:hypothetical protein
MSFFLINGRQWRRDQLAAAPFRSLEKHHDNNLLDLPLKPSQSINQNAHAASLHHLAGLDEEPRPNHGPERLRDIEIERHLKFLWFARSKHLSLPVRSHPRESCASITDCESGQ